MTTATQRQISYYNSMLDTIAASPEFSDMVGVIAAAREQFPSLTTAEASVRIDRAKATVKALKPSAVFVVAPPIKRVTDGDYALQDGDTLKFYTVSTGNKGQWTGFQFVTVHASDERFPVKGETRKAVLAAIAADPAEASGRYGRHFQRCGRCHKQLTDEVSRQRGIGPDCFKKYFDGACFE
jgi:hypothetical protein